MKLRVIQEHHLRYKKIDGYDWTEYIYKGEHMIITLLSRRKYISTGFMKTLEDWIKQHNFITINLDNAYKIQKQIRRKK